VGSASNVGEERMVINKQPECEEVGLWLQGDISSEQPNLISRLRRHAVSCPRCRGMLFLTHFELMGRPQPQHRFISCEICQQDLAAYIDIMQDQGELTAAQTYPHVWWHLWTCEECVEIFEDTLTLAQRFRFEPFINLNPNVKTASANRIPAFTVRSFTLSRSIFAPIFGNLSQYGTSRKVGVTELVWHEHEEFADCLVSFVLGQVYEQTCDLRVETTPATQGRVQLNLGVHRFSAPLDQAGKATFCDVPLALLSDPDGPDLHCLIEIPTQD